MNKTGAFLLLMLLNGFWLDARAQQYLPVDAASRIVFVIKNMGMGTEGRLTGLEGEIRFNPANLKQSQFSVSVDAGTINTDISIRDSALKTEDFLDTRRHPRISFQSRQILPGATAGTYLAKGTLTIKGISREIAFPFTVSVREEGIQLNGEIRINRLDYKIAVKSDVLSSGLTVNLSVFAKKA